MCIDGQNGLAFIGWESFKLIRIMLSRHYKNGSASARAVAEASLEWKSCQTCTIEELNEAVWSEEVYRMTVDESEQRMRVIWESEARAKELLSCSSVSYDAVWQLLQEAQLQGQRTKRQSKLAEPRDSGSRRIQMWIVGMYCYELLP